MSHTERCPTCGGPGPDPAFDAWVDRIAAMQQASRDAYDREHPEATVVRREEAEHWNKMHRARTARLTEIFSGRRGDQ